MNTHSAQLERWLGVAQVEEFSRAMRGWHGPPIALAGVPGEVYACGDGDFTGRIRGGFEATLHCFLRETGRRLRRATRSRATFGAGGFSTLADVLVSGKYGRRETCYFNKAVGAAAGAGGVVCGWRSAAVPAAGSAAGNAPGGTAYTSSTSGGMYFLPPRSGEKCYFAGGQFFVNTASSLGSCLLHDRLFSVNKTINSTATEAVTGVPTRYQSTTPGAADYAAGNFLFIECNVSLAAGAHNHTVCQYTDQDGNATASLPSLAGITGVTNGRLDMPLFTWFAPLATGDSGIKVLTQMQTDAAIATGGLEFTIAHPIAWFPSSLISSFGTATDAIRSAFNMVRIFDDACLSMLYYENSNTISTINGVFDIVQG